MDFEFSSESLMLRDMVRRFVQKEVRPLEMGFFTTGELKPDEAARLKASVEQMGLWGLLVPEKYGGGGLDTVSACLVEQELGGTFVPVEIGAVPHLLYACAGEQVQRYLQPVLAGERRAIVAAREPGGLLPEAWAATATPLEEGYLLTGTKLIGCIPAPQDFVIVLARAPRGPTAFVVEAAAPGMRLVRGEPLMLRLESVASAPGSCLGPEGGALKIGEEEAPRTWILVGARYLGVVGRLLDMAAEHARDWVSFGAPLAVRPAIQRVLAEMEVELESTRWLVYHAAWLADRGDPVRVAAAQVRLQTGEMLERAVDRTTLVFGGPGADPQIEPRRLVHSLAPAETLDFALEQARAVVSAEVLSSTGGR